MSGRFRSAGLDEPGTVFRGRYPPQADRNAPKDDIVAVAGVCNARDRAGGRKIQILWKIIRRSNPNG